MLLSSNFKRREEYSSCSNQFVSILYLYPIVLRNYKTLFQKREKLVGVCRDDNGIYILIKYLPIIIFNQPGSVASLTFLPSRDISRFRSCQLDKTT